MCLHHLGTRELETDRLFLRRLLPADAPRMYCNWAGDPEVTRYLRWEPHRDLFETAALLEAWSLLYRNPDYYQWAITEKATGEVFGAMSIFYSEQGKDPDPAIWRRPGLDFAAGVWEAGYCIGRPWWNRGYTTEALRAVVDYWFTVVGAPWLACAHAEGNPASGRVMEKAGFTFDHPDVYHKFDGTPVACRVYALTAAEYATIQERNRL